MALTGYNKSRLLIYTSNFLEKREGRSPESCHAAIRVRRPPSRRGPRSPLSP
ncbi:unnamed protein product [Tenebrio molitor]|nr:unnamed protein product [Tenebrio molitor]